MDLIKLIDALPDSVHSQCPLIDLGIMTGYSPVVYNGLEKKTFHRLSKTLF